MNVLFGCDNRWESYVKLNDDYWAFYTKLKNSIFVLTEMYYQLDTTLTSFYEILPVPFLQTLIKIICKFVLPKLD